MMDDNRVIWRFRNGHEDLGKFGEELWARIMSDCGLFYIPLHSLPALNGKGPRLQGNDTILPDFEITSNGKVRRCYMDSKCKTSPVRYENANEIREGIDRKDWDAYETISGINRQKCALGMCELFHPPLRRGEDASDWLGALIIQSLGVLGSPILGFSNQAHMVYWPRNKFHVVARTVEPSKLYAIAKGTTKVDDDIRQSVQSFFSRKDPPIQGRFL